MDLQIENPYTAPVLIIEKPEISIVLDAAMAITYCKTYSDLLEGRKTYKALARYAAMNLIIKFSNLSYTEIGNIFGGRDHSTVSHAKKMHKTLSIKTPKGKAVNEAYQITWDMLTQKYFKLKRENLN